jgi:uncharacterized protein YciI
MFVVILTYVKPLEEVDKLKDSHAAFLRRHYDQGHFIVSGRREPRVGGVFISQIDDKARLEAIIREDPFHEHGIATYEVVEFVPGLHDPRFKPFMPMSPP